MTSMCFPDPLYIFHIPVPIWISGKRSLARARSEATPKGGSAHVETRQFVHGVWWRFFLVQGKDMASNIPENVDSSKKKRLKMPVTKGLDGIIPLRHISRNTNIIIQKDRIIMRRGIRCRLAKYIEEILPKKRLRSAAQPSRHFTRESPG